MDVVSMFDSTILFYNYSKNKASHLKTRIGKTTQYLKRIARVKC